MFRIITRENERVVNCMSGHFSTLLEAQIFRGRLLNLFEEFSATSEDYKIEMFKLSNVTYSSLIHSLSEYNENICPIYTLNNMTVNECFEYGLDLSDESWNDFARIEVYEQVMAELKELKETFENNTKHVKCYLTDL